MKKETYQCKYCGKKINKIDYEINNGYCGKCKETIEWKKVLSHIKEYKK
jgi:hypothetical protein